MVPYRSKAKGLVGQEEPSGVGPCWPHQSRLFSASVAGTVSGYLCSWPILGLCMSRCLCIKCLSFIFPGQFLQLIRTQPTTWVMLSRGVCRKHWLPSPLLGQEPFHAPLPPTAPHALLVQLLAFLCPSLDCTVLEGADPVLFALDLGPAQGEPLR